MTDHLEVKQHPLYFWAIVAEGQLLNDLTLLKQLAADEFGSQRALRSPAHITLIRPIRLSPEKLATTRQFIQKIAAETNSFHIQLNGINGFPPRVVYVDVDLNPALNALQHDLMLAFQEHQLIKTSTVNIFHPHVTLAFRDLSADQYEPALRFFDKMNLNFTMSAHAITRLRHHPDGWQIEESVGLGVR